MIIRIATVVCCRSYNSKRDDSAGFSLIKIMPVFSPLAPEANFQICKHILVQFPAATGNQCLPRCSHLVSVPLPILSQNGCISMLPVMSGPTSTQADTPGSWTEGSGKMGDLSANRVCLYTVTEGGRDAL